MAETVPTGVRLVVQGLPNERLRIETNGVPGASGWRTFLTGTADASGSLIRTNTGLGSTGHRFYRAVRP